MKSNFFYTAQGLRPGTSDTPQLSTIQAIGKALIHRLVQSLASTPRTMVQCALVMVLAISGVTSVQAFELKNLDEEVVDLLDYVHDDHWTLVMFWATDCVECERQKPAFEAFHTKYKGSLVSALGVAVDGVENKGLIDEKIALHNPTYPNLMAYSDVYERQFEELAGKPFFGSPRYLLFAPGGQLAAQYIVKIDFEEIAGKIASLKQ